MDAVRFGLSVRALRRRRDWTQVTLGTRAGCSRSAIARLERGEADRFTVAFLERILATLDARLGIRVLWHGEDLDRLLDADHALLVEAVTRLLVGAGWTVHHEVTFQVFGERGAIDVLAVRPRDGAAIVVEVKSVVPDVQAMLSALDRKVRLAPRILRDRGLADPGSMAPVSRVLVLPADRTSRRRIHRHAATFSRALPARTVDVRRWLRGVSQPDRRSEALAGILFVSGVTTPGGRQRVRGAARPRKYG
jgi:transcriptional regulator with XRE-family HTH domain